MASELICTICGRVELVEEPASASDFVCSLCAGSSTPPADAIDQTQVGGPAAVAGGDATVLGAIASGAPDATAMGVGEVPDAEEATLTEFGNYEIIGEIARGGVGIVYRARQKGLDRVVALKVLQGGAFASPQVVQRFFQEAKAAAKLQHPNIVPIHDFGTIEGQHFFTMDFIDGESLADILAKGPMQPKEALDIVGQVAEALHHAHQQGVIHRDIKPGNILINREGRVKVTDFGLAKEIQQEDMHLTVTGQVMGTPRYMSPEQAGGKTMQADARSDIFSLGVTLYEMLTGRPAFDGDNVITMIQKVLTEDPPPPHKVNPKVHRDVETICLKAIDKLPERRYQNALDLTQDIGRFLAGEPIEAKPASAAYRLWRKMQKHGKAIAAYALLLSLTVSGLIYYLTHRPSFIRLKIDTPGAVVHVDGRPVELATWQEGVQLKAGGHHVLIENEPLYDPQELEITTDPGERRTLDVALARRQGTLAIATDPPDAGVTVEGAGGYRATFQGPRVEQQLPTGPYALLIHKENHLAQEQRVQIESRQRLEITFALQPITLWAVPASGSVRSVPVVRDFNGDGVYDVAVGDDDGVVYCVSGRNGIALWVFRARDAVQAPLSSADFNRDGVPDVLAGSTDGQLYCLDGRNGTTLWSLATKGPILGPTLLRDVTGDGVVDAFVGSDDGQLYAVSGATGEILWRFRAAGRIASCLGWAPQEGGEALLVGNLNGSLQCVEPGKGGLLWEVDLGEPLGHPPQIQPAESANRWQAVIPTPKNAADVRSHAVVSLSDHQVTRADANLTTILDLDGDGRPERLVTTAESTICYENDGKTVRWQSTDLAITPSAADVDRDGVLDLVFTDGPDELVWMSGREGVTRGRIKLDGSIGRGYALEDVDRDGTPDVVLGAGRKVYCFSWNGGRKRWLVRASGYFDATLAGAGDRIVAKSVDGEIACYDRTHTSPLWTVATSPQPSPYCGVAAHGETVVDADARTRRLQAWRMADGQQLWQARLPGEPDSPMGAPSTDGELVVVGDGDGGFYCFSLREGAERWKQGLPRVVAPAAFGKDAVYVGDGANNLHCLARSDGALRWHFQTSDPFPSAPALVDLNGDGVEDVVAVCDNGFVYALKGDNGESLWQHQFSTTRSRTRNRVVLADVDGDGFPEGLVGTLKGEVVCLDLKKGEPKWSFALDEPIMSEPAVADLNADGTPDVVVGTMRRHLRCISGKGDRDLWSYEVGGQIRYSAPLLVPAPEEGRPPLVFVGTGPPENGLYCLAGDGPGPKQRGWTGLWQQLTRPR